MDELADILKNAGWLEQDADSSTLVEMLKSKKRPKARKAGSVLQQDIVSAEQKLAAEVSAWEKRVDEQKQKPSNNLLMLEQTLLVLHMLGADFRKLYLAPHAFDDVFPGQKTNETHNVHTNITKGILKKIPAAMADPIMVFDAKGDRLVFMLEIEDENGSSVIVPVEVNKAKDSQNKPINLVVSVYAKDMDDDGKTIPNSEWFVQQAQKNLHYVNTAKVSEWAAFSGVQFPFDDLRNTRKKKLLTEADLVKLKEQNPALYQFIGEAGAARLDRQDKALQMLDRLIVARSMEKNGESPARIKLAVGWERGADGLWRYELDDSEAEYRKYGDARLLSDPEYQRKEELWGQIEASLTGGPDVDESVLEEFDALNF